MTSINALKKELAIVTKAIMPSTVGTRAKEITNLLKEHEECMEKETEGMTPKEKGVFERSLREECMRELYTPEGILRPKYQKIYDDTPHTNTSNIAHYNKSKHQER